MIKLYLLSIKKAFFDFKRSWLFVPASIVFVTVSSVIFKILLSIGAGSSGFSVGGFLAGMFGILSLSVIYNWIKIVASGQKFNLKHIKDFDISFFDSILNVAFILFIVNLLLGSFSNNNKTILIIVNFLIVILCNPIVETIILKETRGIESFSQSFDFIIKNWIEWFIPQIFVLLPLILLSPKSILIIFGVSDILIPSGITFNGLHVTFNSYNMPPYISIFFAFFISLFFVMFRMHLYKELDETTRRSRSFK